MDQKQSGKANDLTRRELMRDGAAAAAGLAAGLGAAGCESIQFGKAAEKPRSYNPEMEYRRLGKTELSISAVCLGGHWKRIDITMKASKRTVAMLLPDVSNRASTILTPAPGRKSWRIPRR